LNLEKEVNLMKKYLLKAERKTKLLFWTASPLFAAGAVIASIGFLMRAPFAICMGACLLSCASVEFLYFFNYGYDFCIDYENREILANILTEKEKREGKIFFSCVMSAEIMEKEALAAEFGYKNAPSHALVLRGAEKNTVIPISWFSEKQREKILEETKKIAGEYL
jgi:hypothetical protein